MSEPQIFRVPISKVEGRLDPLYYFTVNNLELIKKTRYPVKRLADVIDMQRGRFGHRPRNDPRFYDGAYPFIQTGDVVQASLTDGQITYSQTLNELGLKTSRLFDKPVVVLTIAANIGDTAILDYPACFPDSLIGMSPKSADITLAYINIYFKFIRAYLNNLAPQAAQKNINYQQLAPVPIVVPPLSVQEAAAEVYNNALKQKAKNDLEAQALLDGVDAVLYRHLCCSAPVLPVDSLTQRIFKKPISTIEDRLDAPANWTKFGLQSPLYPSIRLSQVAAINPATDFFGISDETVLSFMPMDCVDEVWGEIIEKHSRPYGESKGYTEFQEGDVLWAKITPCMQNGKSAIAQGLLHKRGFGSTEFHVFRVDGSQLDARYLLALLRLKYLREFAVLFFGGSAGHQRVDARFFEKLNIPLPPLPVQKEIVLEIEAVKIKAQTLQQQAQDILEQAKQQVEAMILGGIQ